VTLPRARYVAIMTDSRDTITRPASAAGTFRLGDLAVHRLGFGAMRLTGTGGMGRGEARSPQQSSAVLRRAAELGVNHIDTAGFYFSDSAVANRIIRDALAPYPDDLVIATKVGPTRDRTTGEFGDWARPDQLRARVEQDLDELGLDRLAVVNYRSNGRDDVPAAVAALADLRDEGLLRHVGLSNVDTATLEAALDVTEVVCVQNRHAPGYERSDGDEVLAACGEHGIAFVPFFTIAGQAREDPAQEQYDAVRAIADAHGVSAAQVRIAWNLALGPHVLAIPGTGDLQHLEENVAAAGLRLSGDDLARLADLAA
jgi:pyridoxine 4-dehydrogenase